ncbi:MAG TPA: adenylate/guanylate cyclase domain-containing protein, partial [Gammaproteobacteria bacterium]|nr:adenylate/guanylate cyclase domain-containing protein [Gammaproteobacteria bacterium]
DWSDYALVVDIVGWSVAPTILFIAMGLSIQYRGTIDPKLALRGFTVWTVLSLVLTLIFVFVERTVALRLVGWWHLPPQTGYVTAGAIVAATFQPVRKQLEKRVNRFVERVLPTSLLATGVRHLRAVAVVDISGYTALSAADEQAALLASALVQKEARKQAEGHGGRVVKSTGDGVILCFEDPHQALEAVKALHAGVRTGAAALGIPALDLHSGLHWGEVVEMHDGDIYGMTVNLAARIADWAKAGEIGASDALCSQLQDALQGFVSMGPQSFKNVPEPTSCFRLAVT